MLPKSLQDSCKEVEPMAGIEPATDGLRNRCSTTELHWRPNIAPSLGWLSANPTRAQTSTFHRIIRLRCPSSRPTSRQAVILHATLMIRTLSTNNSCTNDDIQTRKIFLQIGVALFKQRLLLSAADSAARRFAIFSV